MLVFGAVFVDVKGFPSGKYIPTGRNIGRVEFVHGGVCRNVAENFARLGVPVQFVSMVENSAMGVEVRERLNNLGVDTTHLLSEENGMGMWLAILDENGDLAGSISRQPEFRPLEEYVAAHADDILACGDDVIIEFDMNAEIAASVLAAARRHGNKVYSIVGNMGVILKHPEYLREVRCFICNENEAGRLFNMDLSAHTPDEMLAVLVEKSKAAGISSMVITMGAQGSVFVDHENDCSGFCPANSVEMVDSTGAGDAFFTGAVAALSRGLELPKAVFVGTQLAALTLQVAESCCPCATHLLKDS